MIQRITREPPPPPRGSCPQMPRDLETIVLKAIAPDANHRYVSAGELADDLRRFLEDRPIQARRANPVERLGRWCRRNKAVAGLAGTTLFLLVLVAIVASVGYLRTRSALQGEADQRANAQANADLAIEAIDRIFARFSPNLTILHPQHTLESGEGNTAEVAGPPVLSKEAAALLEELLPFYDRLAQQTGDAVGLREKTAQAQRRVAAIRQRLGQFDQAVQAYQQAIAVFEGLSGAQPPPAGKIAPPGAGRDTQTRTDRVWGPGATCVPQCLPTGDRRHRERVGTNVPIPAAVWRSTPVPPGSPADPSVRRQPTRRRRSATSWPARIISSAPGNVPFPIPILQGRVPPIVAARAYVRPRRKTLRLPRAALPRLMSNAIS